MADVPVQFTQHYGLYNAGDRATFDEAMAGDLVQRRLATYVRAVVEEPPVDKVARPKAPKAPRPRPTRPTSARRSGRSSAVEPAPVEAPASHEPGGEDV